MQSDQSLTREEVIQADLLSEIALLVSGVAIEVTLVLVLIASVTSIAAAQ